MNLSPENKNSAEPPKPRSFGKIAALFISGNIFSMFVRLAAQFVTTMIALPKVLGLFNSINQLGMSYSTFLQFGILNGLNREIPYYAGKGDTKRVYELTAAAQAWTLIVGSTVSFVMFVIAMWHVFKGEYQVAIGWFTNTLVAFSFFYGQLYLTMTYRTSHDFARLAMVSSIQSSILLALTIFVFYFNFYGLCIRAVLTGAAQLLLLWHWRPIKVKPKWNKTHFLHLLKIGFPIFSVDILYEWWNSTFLGTTILLYTSVESFGKYALATNMWQALYVTQWVGFMLFPRMSERYGKNGKVREIIIMGLKVVPYMFMMTIPMAVIGWYVLPPLVHYVLPNYVDAIPAAQWTLITILVSSFQPLTHVFNVVKRQDLSLIAIISGLSVTYITIILRARHGVYLAMFPQCQVIGRVVYLGICYFFLWRLYRKEKLELQSTIS